MHASRSRQPDRSDPKARAGLGCLGLFLAPFFAGGLFALFQGIKNLTTGKTHDGLFLCVFALVFLAVPTAIAVAMFKAHQRKKKQEEVQARLPDEPWQWKPEWTSGQIKSSGGRMLWVAWFFALFWNVLAWAGTFAGYEQIARGKKEALLVLLFPLVGLGLLSWAIYATIQFKKYGVSVFKLLSVPGVIGGSLRGGIEIPVQVSPEKGFKVRLACLRRVTTGSGKNRSTSEYVQWEDEKIIIKDFLDHDRTRTGIPVFFNIPFGQPDSLDGNPAIVWRLEVSAETPGVDFAAQFEVPVFKTQDSQADAPPVKDPTLAFQPAPEEYQPPKDTRIRVRDTADGVEVYFPPARSLGGILGSTLFLAIWTGAIWFMLEKKAPIMFPIVFGFFEVLIVMVWLSSIFYSVRVVASPTGLDIFHRLIFPTCTRRLAAGDVRSVIASSGPQSSGGKARYGLKVTDQSGRDYTAGDVGPDRQHAQWLAARLSACWEKKPGSPR